MKRLIAHVIIGSTIFELLRCNFYASGTKCTYYSDMEGYDHADCKRKNITDVPQDLTLTIQSIDLSYNTMEKLTINSFTRYKRLVKIYMTHMRVITHTNVFEVDTFVKLNQVQLINLTYAQYNIDFTLRWPLSLRIMAVSHNKLHSLNAENLENLEEVYANDITITKFPVFHKNAPLRVIELEDTLIYNWSVLSIAPYCRLEVFLIKFDSSYYLQSKENYCSCRKIDEWVIKFNIKNNPLQCTAPSAEEKKKCNTTFGPQELKLREDCLLTAKSKPWILFVIVFLSILLLLLLSLYILWRKKKPSEDNELTSTPTPSINEEKLSEEELQSEETTSVQGSSSQETPV